MNILITGGCGFIGSHVAEEFSKEHTVFVYDNLSTGNFDNLKGVKIKRFLKGDIVNSNELRGIFRYNDIDCVVHLAALVNVQESMKNVHDTEMVNVIGSLNVLREAKIAGVKHVVFASSSAVYGHTPRSGYCNGRMFLEPKSPYGISKCNAEKYMEFYREYCDINTTSLRFFNVYGPRQSALGGYAAVIPTFIKQALKDEDITIYGDGEQVRDFIFVKDVVTVIEFVIDNGIGGILNIASGQGCTINQLADIIIKATDSKSKIVKKPARKGEVTVSVADVSESRRLGIYAEYNLEKGLNETIKFYRG